MMNIVEIIKKYKLRIPPTVYYELLADIQDAEESIKTDYGQRLKADVVAALKEIQLQAEENIENIYEKDEDDILQLAQHNAFADCFEQYNDLIQEKIEGLQSGKDS